MFYITLQLKLCIVYELILCIMLLEQIIYTDILLPIQGFENPDSGVGIYAPDAEAYTVFSGIFDPIIEDYHKGFKSTDKHPAKDWGDVSTLGDLDPEVRFFFIIELEVRRCWIVINSTHYRQ